MIWNSWSDFFAMGGYAFYVWMSLGMVFFCLLWEVIGLILRRKAVHRRHKGAHRSTHRSNLSPHRSESS